MAHFRKVSIGTFARRGGRVRQQVIMPEKEGKDIAELEEGYSHLKHQVGGGQSCWNWLRELAEMGRGCTAARAERHWEEPKPH